MPIWRAKEDLNDSKPVMISIVTYNRRDILRRTLEAIEQTTPEPHRILVTDNASEDGTGEMLREMESQGKLTAWLLKENLGTSGGRNAHWKECIGFNSIRMDDKVLPLASGWLTSMAFLSEMFHAIVAPPYDPVLNPYRKVAPILELLQYNQDAGRGGPLIYIPAGVTSQLGGVDELGDCKYGWDDLLYIERAMLLGWKFGFSFRTPVEFLAAASPARREGALKYHPLYIERRKEYEEAERDVFMPVESTNGYKAGLAAR